MIEKQKGLFNTTHVNQEEFQKYKQDGFLYSDDFKFERYLPQLMKVSCPLSVYNANVLNVLVNLISHDVTVPYDKKKQDLTIRKKADRVIYAVLFVPTVIV
ncbi:hypothetical protein PIROE2DRAFT_8139 [Piromyces sp. E2]|nr:hypothetical protein PIROE2DRAFT_8139 [Piromyces sp. E2]|eukprot:OUM64923.1 hypothetical protein PIROE2DRAFT_8139 [Piromyces sp. E2]